MLDLAKIAEGVEVIFIFPSALTAETPQLESSRPLG